MYVRVNHVFHGVNPLDKEARHVKQGVLLQMYKDYKGMTLRIGSIGLQSSVTVCLSTYLSICVSDCLSIYL